MSLTTFFGVLLCIWVVAKPICERIDNFINLFDRRIKKLEDAVFYEKNHYSDE